MNRNMGTLDRGVRGFLVAPAAIIAAFILAIGLHRVGHGLFHGHAHGHT